MPLDEASAAEEAGRLLDDYSKPAPPSGRRPYILGLAGLALVVAAVLMLALRPGASGVATSGAQSALMQADEEPECSWEGENCMDTKCCHRVGMTCFEREEGWGSCSKSCDELIATGGDWSCNALGPETPFKYIEPAAEGPASVTLFCFMVQTPGGTVPPGVEEGYEQKIIDAIQAEGLSVFACDASNVYQGRPTTTGDWASIKNTDIFVDVWRQVQGDGVYQAHDWTVKADVDAVFLPERLKMHIIGMKPPAGEPIYFQNIDFKYHFMGALECMNKEAVDVFLGGLDQCAAHVGTDGGEDIFTMECLNALRVNIMEDDAILDDKYSDPANFNLFDIDRCQNDAIVAFHPYKAVNSWMGCHKVAMGEVEPSQFTSCEHRWEGEACSLTSVMDHPGQIDPGTGIVG